MCRKRWRIATLILLAAAPASAQSLDISGAYGNAEGCKFARTGSRDSEEIVEMDETGGHGHGERGGGPA